MKKKLTDSQKLDAILKITTQHLRNQLDSYHHIVRTTGDPDARRNFKQSIVTSIELLEALGIDP
jgi:hypothetical protein